MISELPLERGHDLYCVPVGTPQRERGWALGSRIITIEDAVPDTTWRTVAQRFTYLRDGAAKNVECLYRDRHAVVMFELAASASTLDAAVCAPANVRYYDQLTFPAHHKRSSPPLSRGVNCMRVIRDGEWDRLTIVPTTIDWRTAARALLHLNGWVQSNMPASFALRQADIAWACRRNYENEARAFNHLVRGPE